MRQLPIIYLLLSSFFLLSLSSCRINRYNKLKPRTAFVLSRDSVPPVIKDRNSVKFKTTIDVLKNHLSGILIVKQTDTATAHIVFVTELGMKMFDFELKGTDLNTVYVFEPLNKPTLINALKSNFKHMLLLDIYREGTYAKTKDHELVYGLSSGKHSRFFITDATKKLTMQETFYKQKKESRINYQYNTATGTYTQITCKQYGLVKFYFELNAI